MKSEGRKSRLSISSHAVLTLLYSNLTGFYILPSRPRAKVLPVASVGAGFASCHPERLRQDQEGASPVSFGQGNVG
ncbi:MAG: hypothetical protein A3G20_02215 [Acidobacteria bacterium RIFCSPLOWO2_12_FULL_59_11]|nr:MAG: hypothetical protein A3G20_02215 [Acidobacteria bacterium RIFCSPLOWO2_12_FULL_59_11]